MTKAELIAAIVNAGEDHTASVPELPYVAGRKYFLRTVTYHIVGRVRMIVGKHLILDDASWVADSGRFSESLANGTLNEVEPVPDGWIVNTDAVMDAGPWSHDLPRVAR